MKEEGNKGINFKLFFYALETILIVVLFYFFISPLVYEGIPKAQEEKLVAKKTLDERKATIEALDEIAKKYKKASSEIDKISKIASERVNLPETLFLFERLAANSGMIMEGISFGSVSNAEGETTISALPVKFNVTGSYQSFKNYLNNLTGALPLIDVKTISFSSGDDDKGSLYSFSLSVNTYIEQTGEKKEEKEPEEESSEDSEEENTSTE